MLNESGTTIQSESRPEAAKIFDTMHEIRAVSTLVQEEIKRLKLAEQKSEVIHELGPFVIEHANSPHEAANVSLASAGSVLKLAGKYGKDVLSSTRLEAYQDATAKKADRKLKKELGGKAVSMIVLVGNPLFLNELEDQDMSTPRIEPPLNGKITGTITSFDTANGRLSIADHNIETSVKTLEVQLLHKPSNQAPLEPTVTINFA